MNPLLMMLLWSAGITAGTLVLLAGLLTLLPRMGRPGASAAQRLTRGLPLDGVMAALTLLPWIAAAVLAGWAGLAGAVVGQFIALQVWVAGHELMHREAMRGPRIVRFINRTVGRWRNHAALWVTLIALPGFWFVRIVEILIYPFLIWLLNFPRYRHDEWINVTRQKFDGLVGHDLAWCLYCDWMTGVYALGGEMLRNVESFWCPIRFYDGKKCANCRVDFPDIDGGWVRPDGDMAEVEQTLQQMYGGGERGWFGHPARTRLTINGVPVEAGAQAEARTGG